MNPKIPLFAILILSVFASVSFGQLSITSSSYIGVGMDLLTYSMTSLNELNHGSGGANQEWSFATFPWSYTSTTHVISPSGTPYASHFPSATLCQQTGTDNSSYAYTVVSASLAASLGFAQIQNQTPLVVVYTNQEVLVPFPLSYPHGNWTSVATWTANSTITTDSTIHAVDGWGTMHTQYGNQPVLRTFNRHWTASSAGYVFQWVEYAWINEQGVTVVSVSSDYDVTDPNFTQGYISMTAVRVSDAVAPMAPVAESFSVGQNYPNPFNASTTIAFNLEKASRVSVAVFDVTGREVQAMQDVPVMMQAGEHRMVFDGSNLASGVYFARVMAGENTKTVKMELVK